MVPEPEPGQGPHGGSCAGARGGGLTGPERRLAGWMRRGAARTRCWRGAPAGLDPAGAPAGRLRLARPRGTKRGKHSALCGEETPPLSAALLGVPYRHQRSCCSVK